MFEKKDIVPGGLNYRHPLFLVVAREGSITRAAAKLGVAVQTISGQLACSIVRSGCRCRRRRTRAGADRGGADGACMPTVSSASVSRWSRCLMPVPARSRRA